MYAYAFMMVIKQAVVDSEVITLSRLRQGNSTEGYW